LYQQRLIEGTKQPARLQLEADKAYLNNDLEYRRGQQ
jgi:hypothetical protein